MVLEFEDPREIVTVTLEAADGAATDLTYSLAAPEAPSDLDAARRGVGDMLDRIAAGIDQGLI